MPAQSSSDSLRYFVRDDDVGELTEQLRFFAETFFERELPVSYQVIPARFTPEAAEFLLEKWRRRPDLIEFGQHGLTHSMMVRGKQVWREFGPERSFDEQSRDIIAGMDILRSRLSGGPGIEVFTPPQHKYDAATVKAAAAAGHRVFSASSYPTIRHQLAYFLGRKLRLGSVRHHGISYHERRRPEADILEMSISVAVDNGGALLLKSHEIDRALNYASRMLPTVGLMFHHALYQSDQSRSELVGLADRLSARARAGGRFVALGRLT